MDIKSLLSPSEPAAASRQGNSSVDTVAGQAQAGHSSTSIKDASARQSSRVHQHQQTRHIDAPRSAAIQHRKAQSAHNPHNEPSQRIADHNAATATPDHRPAFVHRSSSNRHDPRLAQLSGQYFTFGESIPTDSSSASSHRQALAQVNGMNVRASPDNPFPNSPRTSLTSPSNQRTLSNRSLATVTMDTTPAPASTPRNLSSDALSPADLSIVTALLDHLSENPYAYDSHLQLVNILHKGFAAHVLSGAAASRYGLLSELRHARDAMNARFAVGEALWRDWLRDEVQLATSTEERLAVLELMQRATQDEPASVHLWQTYVDYVETSYEVCAGVSTTNVVGWSAADLETCRELFTKQMLLDVMEQASKAVTWRIDASHLLWTRYLSALLSAAEDAISSRDHAALSDVELEKLFVARLQTPHAQIDSTLELFTPVIGRLYKDNAETAFSRFEKIMDRPRKQLRARDAHESKIQYAVDTNDQPGIYEAFEKYLQWDRAHKSKTGNEKEMRSYLFERALLHFPTNKQWWVAYIDYVISQQPSSHNPSSSVLPLLERATRHCPWSGELWARRILRSDYERLSHDDIESVKHQATNSGLLDIGGMNDLLKVLVEWCSYLRRHAFTATATEDDLDTAEVGMTMALEDVQQAGKKLYGADFHGDPLFRIENVQIKFFSEARRSNDARKVWRSLVARKKSSYEFWQQYYNWELTMWIHDRMNDKERVETTETGPKLATLVMEEAIAQHNLDWPEKVHEMYVNHFQWHESVEALQDATIVASAFQQKIAAKRAKEAIALAAQQGLPVDTAMPDVEVQPEEISTGEKRKREDDTTVSTNDAKKAKTGQDSLQAEQATSTEAQPKRDREHLTITATNLSTKTSELDLRKFFRDCGEVLSLSLTNNKESGTASAVIEFGTAEEVEAAKTRTGKTLQGHEVQIKGGSMSTLYVANYPPEYDESAVRKLFDAYGEIVTVRFPSLKYNNRRRFCYVQFVTSEQAKAAEDAMDGKILDGQHKLLAKVSDPDAKKQRGGAQAEGREVFAKNIDNNASEDEIRAFFAQQGEVVTINLLKNVTGRRLGSGFIVYKTAEEAANAIELLDNKPLNDRILHVSLSQPKGGAAPADKARKTDIIVSKHEENGTARRGSDVSMTSAPVQDSNDSHKTVRERQVAILELPDTVTDARVTTEMEKHGTVVKIQLRREQNAAIVEFADIKVAFTVREGIDCSALGPATKTGDVKDIFAKTDKKSKAKSSAAAMMPSQLGRATFGSARRGGLGFKRGGLGSAPKSEPTAGSKPNGAGRSNADFKSLFEKSRKAG